MTKYQVTITASYVIELEDLEAVRERISNEYENPVLPDFIPEDSIEYDGGSITYEQL